MIGFSRWPHSENAKIHPDHHPLPLRRLVSGKQGESKGLLRVPHAQAPFCRRTAIGGIKMHAYAEWIDSLNLWRLFESEQPENTLAYFNDITAARQQIVDCGYLDLIIVK